jgi:hypothetical protein
VGCFHSRIDTVYSLGRDAVDANPIQSFRRYQTSQIIPNRSSVKNVQGFGFVKTEYLEGHNVIVVMGGYCLWANSHVYHLMYDIIYLESAVVTLSSQRQMFPKSML